MIWTKILNDENNIAALKLDLSAIAPDDIEVAIEHNPNWQKKCKNATPLYLILSSTSKKNPPNPQNGLANCGWFP